MRRFNAFLSFSLTALLVLPCAATFTATASASVAAPTAAAGVGAQTGAVAGAPSAALAAVSGAAIINPHALPWALVDKRNASLTVFHADGSLAGRSPVLLGVDRGDASVPGVGERTQSGRLRAGDRTTPAGRFVSQPGVNLVGEAVVWVDYDAAFAIHRLRSGASEAVRQQRLSSADPALRRASAGCVVVPVAFFENVVQPLLGRGPAIVVVLPEG